MSKGFSREYLTVIWIKYASYCKLCPNITEGVKNNLIVFIEQTDDNRYCSPLCVLTPVINRDNCTYRLVFGQGIYESNFTANAELDNILSLYLFKD